MAGISTGIRLGLTLVAALMTLAGVVWLWPFASTVSPWVLLAIAGLYIFSHVLRAARLAVLSMNMLGISGRSAALMHFATSPLSLALPFKLGELVRLYELWRMSGTIVYAIIVLLIDRMYDSLFLVPFLVVFVLMGNEASILIVFTLLAAVVPLTVIVIGPKLLTEVQRYVVTSHNNPRTLDVLRQTDAARLHVIHAARVSRNRAPELCVISLLIWLSELLICVLLVNAVTGGSDPLGLLGERLVASWWTVGAGTLAQSALAITLITVLLPWPLAVFLYLARRRNEPSRLNSQAHINRRLVA